MNAKSNLTIADISKITSIPESTLRFYRDKFGHYIPSVGQGRKRRYEPQAVDIFKEIANLSTSGLPILEIEQHLSKRYPHNPVIVESATEPQLHNDHSNRNKTAIEPQNCNDGSITAVTAMGPQHLLSNDGIND